MAEVVWQNTGVDGPVGGPGGFAGLTDPVKDLYYRAAGAIGHLCEAMGIVVRRPAVERMAEAAWSQMGYSLPALPPGHRWVFAHTHEPAPLVECWDQVPESGKDIHRRIAAAIAVQLGHKLADDVSPRPRG